MASNLMFSGLMAALGLAIGPLLGVVVDRTVERLPLRPVHRCPGCRVELPPASLVPILSWFVRCPSGGGRPGLRYPLVDLATAVVFVVLGLRFGPTATLPAYLALGAVLVALSAIDIETHLLPNRIVGPSLLAGTLLVLGWSLVTGDAESARAAILGALLFGGFMALSHLAYPPGMGMGDVKLSPLLGLFIGWLQPGLIDAVRLVMFTIVAALIGGAVGGTLVNVVRSKGRAEIPFGPALAGATLTVITVSPVLTGTGP